MTEQTVQQTNRQTLEQVMSELDTSTGTFEENSVLEEERKKLDITSADLRAVLVDHEDASAEALEDLVDRINKIAEARGAYADNILKTLVSIAQGRHGILVDESSLIQKDMADAESYALRAERFESADVDA